MFKFTFEIKSLPNFLGNYKHFFASFLPQAGFFLKNEDKKQVEVRLNSPKNNMHLPVIFHKKGSYSTLVQH